MQTAFAPLQRSFCNAKNEKEHTCDSKTIGEKSKAVAVVFRNVHNSPNTTNKSEECLSLHLLAETALS